MKWRAATRVCSHIYDVYMRVGVLDGAVLSVSPCRVPFLGRPDSQHQPGRKKREPEAVNRHLSFVSSPTLNGRIGVAVRSKNTWFKTRAGVPDMCLCMRTVYWDGRGAAG